MRSASGLSRPLKLGGGSLPVFFATDEKYERGENRIPFDGVRQFEKGFIVDRESVENLHDLRQLARSERIVPRFTQQPGDPGRRPPRLERPVQHHSLRAFLLRTPKPDLPGEVAKRDCARAHTRSTRPGQRL